MEEVNGYEITRPFTAAGTAYWTIAKKNGTYWFLKKFSTPKYMPNCIDYCKNFEARKRALYDAIHDIGNGNIAVIESFFRWNTLYYIVTECIHESDMTAEHIHELPRNSQLVILRTLAFCMMQLEKRRIVHADLKPSNIMLKPTHAGYYALKLIDFDSSFFEYDPPKDKEDLEGDLTYLSPESLKVMCGEDIGLTSKIDVFAAGIMFHQFLCGELPKFDSAKYDYVCEAVAEGDKLSIHPSIPKNLQELLTSMLAPDPGQRPTFAHIFEILPYPNTSWSEDSPKEYTPVSPKHIDIAASTRSNPWMKKAGALAKTEPKCKDADGSP